MSYMTDVSAERCISIGQLLPLQLSSLTCIIPSHFHIVSAWLLFKRYIPKLFIVDLQPSLMEGNSSKPNIINAA